jgi:hypothetical protein
MEVNHEEIFREKASQRHTHQASKRRVRRLVIIPASDKEGAHIAGRSGVSARTMTDAWRTDSMPTTTATDVPDTIAIIMPLNSACY